MSYANIMNVETSGASPQTARQDNLPYAGVKASHTMAKTDLERVKRYKSIIDSVAESTNIDPALIAAIMSRESRAGNALDSRGYGDHGNAFGLMQVDLKPNGGGNHPRGHWDSREHVEHATGILVDFTNKISRKFPDWSREWKLKGGISAYNMGDGNVSGYHNVDEKTTGGDYSNDVVARAQWYKKNGGF